MNLVNNYNDYIIDFILESIKKDEFYLIISDELAELLNTLYESNSIAKKIMDYSNKGRAYYESKYKITLLDVNNKKDESGNPVYDSISFITSSKLIEIVSKNLEIDHKDPEQLENNFDLIRRTINRNKEHYFSIKGRSDTTIGRIVRKLFDNEFTDVQIEEFVNKFKSARDTSKDFELVSGDDIMYWYNKEQYMDGGVLGDSCMRHEECSNYIKFYAKSPEKISLLILHDNTNPEKIRGRAIVWNLDEPKNRIFMDRIFYTNDYIMNLFKSYAKEQGWLYKKNQNNNSDGPFIDTKTEQEFYDFKLVVNDVNDNNEYPYLDTLKFYDNNSLTNIIDEDDNNTDVKKLTRTNGSYKLVGVYSSFYQEHIDPTNYHMCLWDDGYRNDDDCFYSEYYNGYVANSYADDNGTWCDYCDTDSNWRDDGDYIEIGMRTATTSYAEENFYYSEYSDEWVKYAVYSNHHETYIEKDNAVKVYTNADQSESDWRADNDKTWWEDENGDKYDNSIKK